jgi:hypothetical protein
MSLAGHNIPAVIREIARATLEQDNKAAWQEIELMLLVTGIAPRDIPSVKRAVFDERRRLRRYNAAVG